jgi:zinc protease
VPSNAALVVAGDFQSADAKKFGEKYFGWMKRVAEPPHAAPAPATLAKDDRVELEDAVELSQLTIAWNSPAALSDGDAACDLLSGALGNGKSSRLYKALVYDKKIAQKVSVEQRGMRYGGNFVITVTAQPGHDAAELERETLAEIRRLEAAPVTNEELSRSRAVVETQTLRNAERLLNMADLLNTFEYYFGDPGQLGKKLLARYDSVDAAQIGAVAKEVLGKPHLSILVEPRGKTKNAPVASPIKDATKATTVQPNAKGGK